MEPTISYESFVEDLDPGDSFTTSLAELLVKEMADRRNRQAPADRRLIADRTAKGLRMLAAPARVHRDRGVRGLLGRRTSLNLSDYLTVPPEEMELDDETESLEGMLEPPGAASNADLYDAYVAPQPHDPATRVRQARASAMLRQRHEDWAAQEGVPWTMPWATSAGTGASGAALTRQGSIRRPPARSRTTDFSDFTARRRSSTRGEAPEDDAVPPRRFFPPMRRLELPWGSYPDATVPAPSQYPELTPSSSSSATPPEPPAVAPERERTRPLSWLSRHAPSPSPLPHTVPGPTDSPPPRLRRGGVRPPEALLSWRVSMLGSRRESDAGGGDTEVEEDEVVGSGPYELRGADTANDPGPGDGPLEA
ncbi:hypothetical protein BV25DRAFT_1821363 [Artomyces pyxidatus]|uniref:Uncharacterized protein n=1 Tax=Artomyces pyxidatus TaxID=48021 RepID=A0ACB8T9U9_9AGAM|nr:hypothetical protein BV25DRAFT_1821363 [Artomyces pyxidatus]